MLNFCGWSFLDGLAVALIVVGVIEWAVLGIKPRRRP